MCVKEGRILLTLDLDFADIRVYPPQALPGLVVLRPDDEGSGARASSEQIVASPDYELRLFSIVGSVRCFSPRGTARLSEISELSVKVEDVPQGVALVRFDDCARGREWREHPGLETVERPVLFGRERTRRRLIPPKEEDAGRPETRVASAKRGSLHLAFLVQASPEDSVADNGVERPRTEVSTDRHDRVDDVSSRAVPRGPWIEIDRAEILEAEIISLVMSRIQLDSDEENPLILRLVGDVRQDDIFEDSAILRIEREGELSGWAKPDDELYQEACCVVDEAFRPHRHAHSASYHVSCGDHYACVGVAARCSGQAQTAPSLIRSLVECRGRLAVNFALAGISDSASLHSERGVGL